MKLFLRAGKAASYTRNDPEKEKQAVLDEIERYINADTVSVSVEIVCADEDPEIPGAEAGSASHLDKVQRHKGLCDALNAFLYAKKNHDYGDSFHRTFVEEGMAMARIRLGDKFYRFKTLSRGGERKVNDESIRDTLLDLANYAIMMVLEMEIAERCSSSSLED